MQLLTENRLLQHDVGLFQNGGHDVGAVLLELHMRTQTDVFGIQGLQSGIVIPLGHLDLWDTWVFQVVRKENPQKIINFSGGRAINNAAIDTWFPTVDSG